MLGKSLESLIHSDIHSFNKYLLSARCWDNVVNRSDLVSSFMRFTSQQREQTGQANINQVISARHKYHEANGASHAPVSQSKEEMLHREAAQRHVRSLDGTVLFSLL